jgi:hypothetical protein
MIINLISGPRNVSTALMYSFAQRADTKVIDEPFYGYYLKETGIIHPGRKRIMQSMSTDIEEITGNILKMNGKDDILFLKNMAHHHIRANDEFLLSAENVFLIRNPSELVLSFSKVIKEPTIDDIGIKKSLELHQYLLKNGGNAVVIDSGELLKDPPVMLEKLCQAIPVPFDASMLSWPAGARPEDGVWAKYWYKQLHKTTGFVKSEPKAVDVPAHLQPLCEEAMKYYQQLYHLSIKYK